MADNAFVPCANYEKSRIGWVSPLGNAVDVTKGKDATTAPMFTHALGDYIMLCAQKQDRLLPSSVVREATRQR